jgi:nucleotidyltransferase substrate binding protein (TIGR01987 family)
MEIDIRWLQRLDNYEKALSNLTEAVQLAAQRPLSKLEKQGLIQSFEFTHELAWNVMKDYFAYQGNPAITGSRDAVREAFSANLIINGDVWMAMIKSRNQTSHTYNQGIADEITNLIFKYYHAEFMTFLQSMQQLKSIGI